MTATNRKLIEANVSHNVRQQNARQLRSDFLAAMVKALCNRFGRSATHSVGEVQVNTQA